MIKPEDSIKYHEILKQYWGYDTFRGQQLEAINAIVAERKDIFFLAPTSLRKISNLSSTSFVS